jgi:LuxR family transcriptional regulator
LTEVLHLLARIAAAGTVEDAWAPLCQRLAEDGFGRVTYGFTRSRTDRSMGNPDDTVVLTWPHSAAAEAGLRSGFFARSPLYRWIVQNVGTCTWRWVDEALRAEKLTAEEAEAVRLYHSLGVVAGVTISFPANSPRSRGAIGLIADQGLTHDDVDLIWADKGAELAALCHMAHLRITSLPLKTERRALTDRQREALEWAADGKTTQDIAVLMGISTAMVEKHLRLAREVLAVENTAHAVAKAAFLNQIFVPPPPRRGPGRPRVGNPSLS